MLLASGAPSPGLQFRRQRGEWAYYNFGGMTGLRNTAKAMPKETCYSCHVRHAKQDNVFMQFYPLLEDVAPRPTRARDVAPAVHESQAGSHQQPAATGALALRGLDPVLLVTGQEEMGKPEIIAVHNGRRYQFVSEPNRARFESRPSAYVKP